MNEGPAPYTCKHKCERDELKDELRVARVEAYKEIERLEAALESVMAINPEEYGKQGIWKAREICRLALNK